MTKLRGSEHDEGRTHTPPKKTKTKHLPPHRAREDVEKKQPEKVLAEDGYQQQQGA